MRARGSQRRETDVRARAGPCARKETFSPLVSVSQQLKSDQEAPKRRLQRRLRASASTSTPRRAASRRVVTTEATAGGAAVSLQPSHFGVHVPQNHPPFPISHFHFRPNLFDGLPPQSALKLEIKT